MKTRLSIALIFICLATVTHAQSQDYTINTLLGNGRSGASGGYGAISNKFTTINGHHANLVEVYGGWYVSHRFLLGIGAAAVTNDIPVSPEFSASPGTPMSYEYGQLGLMTEYVIGSGKAIHLAFQLFSGAGFTIQYNRREIDSNQWGDQDHQAYDENWFFVAEPGIKLEMNLLRWMRFSPGISYRAAFNSTANGLSDDAISGIAYNLTLKFGKF